ncbi:hypothetical protein [Halomonas urumqiensis]|uniref:hypothetical protein n=1 Tax=Halomonas urumqiensis TaxID=1684789 RepID=UPI0015E14281|nr:hypothetical protein [Halomonas urumqiensis]GHE22229.1 hypothetical protein GCM10017767_27500 [Halomonas urumqiensis]
MTTETLSHSETATAPKASLAKRIGVAAYRLLDRMTEAAYRQHKGFLRHPYHL